MSGIGQGLVAHFFPEVPDFDDGTGGLVVEFPDLLPVRRPGGCEYVGMEILVVRVAARFPGFFVRKMDGQVSGEAEPVNKPGGELAGKFDLAGMG